jgi:RNA polymerase sigma-70 factor (ECF subfamily)
LLAALSAQQPQFEFNDSHFHLTNFALNAPNATAPSDSDLVGMARENRRGAFEKLINRHYSTCFHFAISILHDRGDAEEEVQNAFWKAFEHLDQLRGAAEFSSWLLRIVANHCLMRLRLRKCARVFHLDQNSGREGEGSMELPSAASDPEYELIQSELAGMLQREIGRMPKLLRNVVLLYDFQHLPMRDVAQRLEIKIPAAKSRLFRARMELRRRVTEHCGLRSYHAAIERPGPAREIDPLSVRSNRFETKLKCRRDVTCTRTYT